MKQKRIAIGLQKGGVGKSTLSVNMAVTTALFWRNENRRVLLVDMDAQATSTGYFASKDDPIPPSRSIAALFPRDDPWQIVKNDVGLIHKTRIPNLDIVPGHIMQAIADWGQYEDPGRRLQYWLDSTAHQYDLVVIDCPPSLGRLTTNSLIAADYVIIPVQPEGPSCDAVPLFVDTIKRIRSVNEKLAVAGIVITMIDARTNAHKYYRDSLISQFDKLVIATLPRATAIGEAALRKLALLEDSPQGRVASEMRQVVRSILKAVGVDHGSEAAD